MSEKINSYSFVSFINSTWDWKFLIFSITSLNPESKDEAALYTRYVYNSHHMQLFWRYKYEKAIFILRYTWHSWSSGWFSTHLCANTNQHSSSSVILFSLFRADIGNKWISFPVTLVRRFILSRINARADLSFARIRFVADL